LGRADRAADAPAGRCRWCACHDGGAGAGRRHEVPMLNPDRGRSMTARLSSERDDRPFAGHPWTHPRGRELVRWNCRRHSPSTGSARSRLDGGRDVDSGCAAGANGRVRRSSRRPRCH
jgi:hypothetical protein